MHAPWQGHEDLRQDERVMQLFGLVNTMLAHDRTTAERDLSIARYAVIPLSPNSGAHGTPHAVASCAWTCNPRECDRQPGHSTSRMCALPASSCRWG